MSNMQTGTGWVRKHIEDVIFGLAKIIFSPECLMRFPVILPFLFDRTVIIFHSNALRYWFILNAGPIRLYYLPPATGCKKISLKSTSHFRITFSGCENSKTFAKGERLGRPD